MTDNSSEQQWIRNRLDRIDENIVKVLMGQTSIANKVEMLEQRVTELEDGQEALDRKIDTALLPGRAIRWLLAAIAAMAAAVAGLKALGVRVSIEASSTAEQQEPPASITAKESSK